jgi:uncharacterized alpha-E superfamily protein
MTQLMQYGSRFAPEHESECVEILLEIAESSITYHSRYLSSLQTDLMLDLLLADDTNPRAFAFQMDRIVEHIKALPTAGPEAASLNQFAGELRERIRRTSMTKLLVRDADGDFYNLETFLAEASTDLNDISSLLTRNYLTHAQPHANV